MRIASLLASGTELVCALGLGDRLVGRSDACDHPPWVERLPVLSRAAFDATGSSREIDERVRARLRDGLPLYDVDDRLLTALAPDVVITQTHCEVCAVSPGDIGRDGATATRQQVVALRAGTLDGILDGFGRVAAVLGAADAGARLVAGIRQRLAALRAATSGLRRPTVACLEWIEPVFAMGNWGPELVDHAGGTCVLGNAGAHSASIPWGAVVEADPEFLVVAPCGFGLARTLAEMHVLAANPGWSGLRAVRGGNVVVADGNLYFNRSGPLVFDSAELLAEILHPDRFPPRHEGARWRRYGTA